MDEESTNENKVGDFTPDRKFYAETSTLRMIVRIIAMCHSEKLLGVISGEPGTGKSMAVEAYIQTVHNTGRQPIYYRATDSARTMRDFLYGLAGVCGIEHYHLNSGWKDPNRVFQHIVSALQNMRDPALIIDEAQYLGKSLHLIRDLYDLAGMGIVLVANPSFRDGITQRRNNGAYQFAALAARIDVDHLVEQPNNADIQAICDFIDLKGAGARELVAQIINGDGHLHRLAGLRKIAQAFAGEGKPVSGHDIYEAAKVVGIK